MEVISELHLLEQVASEEHIGTMAENLLEAMMDNSTCKTKVQRGYQAFWRVVQPSIALWRVPSMHESYKMILKTVTILIKFPEQLKVVIGAILGVQGLGMRR